MPEVEYKNKDIELSPEHRAIFDGGISSITNRRTI